jgi:hypothetical protein
MGKIMFLILTGMLLTVTACSNHQTAKKGADMDTSTSVTLQGDSAIYGLACDGCTDTVIVLLPEDGSDPVTYEILRATKERRVIGRPKIGDKLAVMLNPENKKEAISVVDIDELKGSWVYQVMPTLRKRAAMLKDGDLKNSHKLDSLIKSLMVPREYGFKLKRDNQVSTIGRVRQATVTDDESPVEYPTLKRYSEWYTWNNKIVFMETNNPLEKKKRQVVSCDTAEILLMLKDSLQLRFNDEVRNYYRKENPGD